MKIFYLVVLFFCSCSLFAQSFTAMSFNLRYDNAADKENQWENRKSELAGLIGYYHPDFLGIQEGLLHQVLYLKNKVSHYKFVGVGREDGKERGEFAAIFYDSTKFVCTEQKTFWLSATPQTVSVGWDAALPRICTFGKFKNLKTSEVIYVFNTHFDHMGAEARNMSAKLILQKIADLGLENEPILVMGDFNAEPHSEPIETLKNALDLGFETTEKPFYGPPGTFNGFENCIAVQRQIDYIFTKNIVVKTYRHIDDKRGNNLYISDHYPVFAELETLKTSIK